MSISLEPIWVDSNDILAELCEKWSQQVSIAVDTADLVKSCEFQPSVNGGC